MKKKSLYLLISLAVIVVAAAIMSSSIYGKKKQEENAILAMYVICGNGYSLFIGQEDESAFSATFPEELYDVEGKKITKSDLTTGNIIKIMGDGMMLESDPGQYPGVTRMEVVKEGEPSDADKYQKMLKRYYREPNPSRPPTLGIEQKDGIAVIFHTKITAGSYKWNYVDKDGREKSAVKEGKHVLMWKKITEIDNENAKDLVLHFSKEPQEVSVERWESSQRISGDAPDEFPKGEEVTLKTKEDRPVIPDAAPGYVYRVTAVWENGNREFGFVLD